MHWTCAIKGLVRLPSIWLKQLPPLKNLEKLRCEPSLKVSVLFISHCISPSNLDFFTCPNTAFLPSHDPNEIWPEPISFFVSCFTYCPLPKGPNHCHHKLYGSFPWPSNSEQKFSLTVLSQTYLKELCLHYYYYPTY